MSRKGEKRSRALMETDKPVCQFCKTSTKNKYYLGKMMSYENITAHYYCILFAPGLVQNGNLNEGIKGFLVEDIKKELKRGGRLFCSYCGEKGAVIGCAVNECKIKFHMTCGLVKDSFHDFHNAKRSYTSFCSEHRPFQKPIRIPNLKKETNSNVCLVCQETVQTKPKPDTLWSPCCGKWFHRECVIKLSYHSGKHHLKCPACNDKKQFVREMQKSGVHVPTRDASWEKTDTYQDLYRKQYRCEAVKCLDKKGREHNGDDEWEIFACDSCGSNAVHIRCAKLTVGSEEWYCSVCKPIVKKSKLVLNEN